ncbi:MAG: hypothetical protein U1E51_27290 [Candidatus Binatia bacterium]|nr:hypothetical protein [Candidatus Binatia bacterium]
MKDRTINLDALRQSQFYDWEEEKVEEKAKKPNCYECQYRGECPGSAHSRCTHPEAQQTTKGDPFAEVLAIFGSVGRGPGLHVRALNVEGHPRGISNGWFNWPVNFDPIWLLRCDGFTPKKGKDNP